MANRQSMSAPLTGASAPAGTSSGSGSSITSPTTAHPSAWSLQQVVQWLQSLQPSSIAQAHASKFREHDIEGDVLLDLDAEALREIGVTSIGHRLVILRGIYELKRRWNVEIDEDAWRPDIASVEGRGGVPPGTLASVTTTDLARALHDRDERLWLLEQEVARLVDWLMRYTDDSTTAAKTVEALRPYLPPSKPHTSLPISIQGHSRGGFDSRSAQNGTLQPGGGFDLDGSGASSGRGSKTPLAASSFRAAAHEAHGHSPYGAPGNILQGGFSPTSSTPGATPTTAHPPISIANDATKTNSVASTSTLVSSGTNSGVFNSTPYTAGNAALSAIPPSSTSLGVGAGGTILPSSPFSVSSISGSQDNHKKDSRGNSGGSGDTPYKSFRVTLDDPCYKVLPAALKKYKINDDWRQYALFICYGTTERCLSYDEKPLLLFQKLKENKQSPVFMLRHIRDVKSPIAIANAKAAARKGTAADSSAAASTSPSTQRSGVGKVADVVAKFSGGASGGSKDADGGEGSGSAGSGGSGEKGGETAFIDSMPGHPRLTGPAAQLADGKTADGGRGAAAAASASGSDTYAIAIYPYVSERDDEFDVSVGDTFIVKSKAKGWWVVQRDARAKGHPVVEGVVRNADGTPRNGGEIKSGWVPAGCLLETRQPLSAIVSLPPADTTADALLGGSPTTPRTPQAGTRMEEAQAKALAQYMASVPIPPSVITSTSTPGILLMDYNNDEENLHLTKDQRLRVFKRYNHWSYCVEEGGNHVRAWLPSWYIGKIGSSSSRSTAGSQARNPVSGSGHGGSGISVSSHLSNRTDTL